MTVNVKRNDTAVVFADTLEWTDGPQADLAGCTVRFLMSNGDDKDVDGAATITDSAAREVQYQVAADDLDTAGTFKQEWEVTFADLTVLTVPTRGHNTVRVVPDLG